MMLVSKTGKSKKKNKDIGGPKKPITKESVIKELEPDLKDMMMNDYLDVLKETGRKKYDEIINKYIKKSKVLVKKLVTIFPYSKSTINRIKNNLNSLKANKNNEKIYSIIKEKFEKRKRRYERRQIQAILFKKYHINLSDRQIGRIMNKLYLKCTIRNKRKIKEIKNTNLKNVIIHSDHPSAYTSESFLKVLSEKQWIQSMSRIGNSLDNREIEYLFSIFKTELIYQLDMSKITFKQLEKIIDEYVYYYNNVRIQKKLGWKAPSEV